MEKITPVVATTLSNYASTPQATVSHGNKRHAHLSTTDVSEGEEDDPLVAATKIMNNALQLFKPDTNLEFVLDQESGTHLVRLIDTETQEVLRQIPSEVMLRIAKSIQEFESMLKKQKKMQNSEILHPGTILDDVV